MSEYRTYTISTIDSTEHLDFLSDWESLDMTGVSVSLIEYAPVAEVITVGVGGEDLTDFDALFVSFVNTWRGSPPDTNELAYVGDKCAVVEA